MKKSSERESTQKMGFARVPLTDSADCGTFKHSHSTEEVISMLTHRAVDVSKLKIRLRVRMTGFLQEDSDWCAGAGLQGTLM